MRRPEEFTRVYREGLAKRLGPLLIHALPNDHGELRLGLSVPRRAGNAVRRNRIKRRLREAFRQYRHEWPVGLDVVVTVRAHEPLDVTAYAERLGGALERLERRRQESS